MLIDLKVEGFQGEKITVLNNLSYQGFITLYYLAHILIDYLSLLTADSDNQCFEHLLNFLPLTLSTHMPGSQAGRDILF